MGNFNITPNQPRVMILDPNATALNDTDKVMKAAIAFAMRLGCYWERVNYTTAVTGPFREKWDLILVPHVTDSQTSYTNLQTAVKKLEDPTIPVAVMQCESFALNSTIQAITGVTTANTSAASITVPSLSNWESRTTGTTYWYGERATALNANATAIATDGTNTQMWQFDIGTHPTLWIAGYSNSENPGTKFFQPWFCFQWMCDQQSTEDKNNEVRDKVKPAYMLIRWDGLDEALMVTAHDAGDLDTVYNKALTYGVKEIWLAASWTGVATPGARDSDTANWFLNRAETEYKGTTSSRLFRVMNHETDVVDGASAKCTSDGTSFDAFIAAGRLYEQECDELTDYGFILGKDGYGEGYPNVQNANKMNNPAALFLSGGDTYRVWDATDVTWYGGYKCDLWLEHDEAYPSSAETPTTTKTYSHNWNGGQTLTCFSMDAYTAVADLAITIKQEYLEAMIWGGGLYWHGNGIQNHVDYCDDTFSIFTHCPNIVKSGPWEDMKEELKRGSGIWYI